MNGFPQLRIRTGYSFREAYGRPPEVLARLKEIDTPLFGVVDSTTWGHIRFKRAADAAEIPMAFGAEIPLYGGLMDYRPKVWALARDTRKFYRMTTAASANKGISVEALRDWDGGYRFLGGAAFGGIDPDAIDYVDLNPASMLSASQNLRWARHNGKPLIVTSYNDMPTAAHAPFAYAWEVRESPQPRIIMSVDELRKAFGGMLSAAEFDKAVQNVHGIAGVLKDVQLAKAPSIHFEGDLEALCRSGQAKRLAAGQIKEWTAEYEDRLLMELETIKAKNFDSYFLMVSDLIRYAKQHMIVGPGRGSSSGSLVCYLTEIVEVDPIRWGLLFYRFVSIERSDLPDVDCDFADTKRHMVFDYLQDKYQHENVAKIGNIALLQAASVLAQVGKKFDIPISDTMNVRNSLIEYTSGDERYGKALADTMANTAPGQSFQKKYPLAAQCVADLEQHPSHTSVHAAGILVCNEPISDFCTVSAEGVANLDKYDAEYLNLLKIDALGLRTLGVIEDAGVITAEELYNLEYDDMTVLDQLNQGKFSAVFQFEGDAVRSVTRGVKINRFEQLDHLTALARPGPLSSGMGNLYIERSNGRKPMAYDAPEMEKYLKDTMGVFLYQEQIMSVVKDIGLFNWEKTSAIRKAMSARKGEEFFNKMGDDFVNGATSQGMAEETAKKIWREMVTFGSWGFNKAHSLSYAVVTYWTLYMKRYFPLEFAAACLRSAKSDDQTISILRELHKEGVSYTALDPEFSGVNWRVADGRLLGGIQNAKGYGAAKSLAYVQKRDAGTLTDKDRERLAKAPVLYADLYEAHAKFGEYFRQPRLIGVTSGDPIIGMAECKDRDECLVIAKLTKKVLSDENEPIRVKKRGGKIMKGPTQFLDLMMVDDSTDGAMRFRIRPEKYEALGKPILEGAAGGSWFLVRAWKISGIGMFIVKNIKQITPP